MTANRIASSFPSLAVATVLAAVAGLAACGSSTDPAPAPLPSVTAGCAAYCTSVTTNCTTANGNLQFADATACNAYCSTALTATPEIWSEGTAGATSGNSLACRAYHGGAPAAAIPGTHCKHAGPTGGNLCGGLCENYCALQASLCTGTNQITFSAGGCLADCALFAQDGLNDTKAGNNVQCRINHLGLIVAGGPAATHCGHARPTPTGACI
jgi:hypothetical protein